MVIFYIVLISLFISSISYALFIILSKLLQANITFVKSKMKVSKSSLNRLIISDPMRLKIVQNINENCPRLSDDFDLKKAKEILSPLTLNFDFPTYVLEVTNNSIISNVYKEISFFKTLEKNGTYVNLVVITACDPKRAYNLKHCLAKLDFEVSPVRLFAKNDLSTMQTQLLNMLNINYYCGVKINVNRGNIAEYCIKSRKNTPYTINMNSTMQTGQKQRWVLCNFEVTKNQTYNYITDTYITRLDFSKAEGKEIVTKFLPLDNIKYFNVEVHGFYIKLTNFDSGEQVFFSSNRPIFSKAIFNKKGIYFSFVVDTQFIYITRSCQRQNMESILECERAFIKSQTLLNNLPKISVKSSNAVLDEMVNITLPNQIIKLALSDEFEANDSFKAFAFLSREFTFGTDKLSKLILKYFDILRTYYGVEFGKKGVYLSSKKEKLIDSKVTFKKQNEVFSIDIKNKNLDPMTYKIGGVEYTGTNYLPYDKLSKTLILQM